MAFEVTAKLTHILQKQSGQGRNGTWEKQDFVVETQESFPKKICVTCWGDKIDTLNRFNIGDMIKVSFDVESREYNGKWFTNLKAWRLDSVGNQNGSNASDYPPPPSLDDLPPEPEEGGDLPF